MATREVDNIGYKEDHGEKKDKKSKRTERKMKKRKKEKNNEHMESPESNGNTDIRERKESIRTSTVEPVSKALESKERLKKECKRKRKKAEDSDQADLSDDESKSNDDNDNTDSLKYKEQRRLERKKRRLERKELLQQVPQLDPETGVSYTKQQLRRMMKRVSRGLPPLETEEEKKQRLQNEMEWKKQVMDEEEELIFKDSKTISLREDENDDDDEENQEDLEGEAIDEENENGDREDEDTDEGDDVDETRRESNDANSQKKEDYVQFTGKNLPRNNNKQTTKISTKPPRHEKKPVPFDYICSACENRHQPKHWIYDCPDKDRSVTKNKNSNGRGMKDPDKRKVFVSGLPFDAKMKDVIDIFTTHISDCNIIKCKLIRFPDTGRCTGQAYLTFSTEVDATRALHLSGTKIDNINNSETTSTKQQRVQLALKVSKCLNRYEAHRVHNHHHRK